MKIGDIVIVSFPYTDLVSYKARPAVVLNAIQDNYEDIIVCLITSVVPNDLGKFHLRIYPDGQNNLKTVSVIKVSRISTVEKDKIKAVIGKLNPNQLEEFKATFKALAD